MIQRTRRGLGDVTGALGDLGVLVPLLVGLAAFNGVPLGASLAVVGAAYLAAAFLFRLPAPVQPLKIACALALALGLGRATLGAAGLLMGAALLAIHASGAADKLASWVPTRVVRGMQLGVGLLLIQGALTLLRKGQTGAIVPTAAWGAPVLSDLRAAFALLVLPQLPVTLSNAVVGSADAARRYYRWRARAVTASRLCLSMGLLNLAAGAAGVMPVCHGSSGWTAHRRLGARTWRSTAGLGLACLAAAAWAGTPDPAALAPWYPWLAALLAYVGARHAALVLDLRRDTASLVLAASVGALSWATKNPAIGLAWGLAADGAARLAARRLRREALA